MEKSDSIRKSQKIAARLESIYQQIKDYPRPIAGCDEQFNFLLRERGQLGKELEKFRVDVN
jgi:hypothetical protein